MKMRFNDVMVAGALSAMMIVGPGCGFISKLTRMPAGAGRAEPPTKIEDRALAVGTLAPAFTLPSHTGSSFSLEEKLTTNAVVVVFFRGEWCPLCARQLIELAENRQALDATGATFVALNPYSQELSAAFAAETNWPYPILIDSDRKTIKAYGLFDAETNTAWPTIYVIDRKGVIRYRGLSETKDVRPTSKHLLAALRALPPTPSSSHATKAEAEAPSDPPSAPAPTTHAPLAAEPGKQEATSAEPPESQ